MAGENRTPRIVIDFEHGGFEFQDTSGSVHFLTEFRSTFGAFTDVWLFHDAAAALIRGFYYPITAPERYGIPRGQGPRCVLIDDHGDQLWLSQASCGGTDDQAEAALAVLTALSVSPPSLVDHDEMHFNSGTLVASRLLADPRPSAPPGKTVAHENRIICRMEFDTPVTTPEDLREIWDLSTEPHAWLGRPTSLTLYDSRSRSQLAGHEGCHLIAIGETGRELWLQFPEPDTYDRLTLTARAGYTGSFTEYEAIKAAIFRAVGVDITATDRSWRDIVLARHPSPATVVSWP